MDCIRVRVGKKKNWHKTMTRQEEIHSVSNQLSELYKCSKTFKMGFEAGAKWADEHPKSLWISVKDDLPCNYPDNIHFGFTDKVIATDGTSIFILHMKKCKDNKWIWCNVDSVDISHIITHWMPFPEPPKKITKL